MSMPNSFFVCVDDRLMNQKRLKPPRKIRHILRQTLGHTQKPESELVASPGNFSSGIPVAG